MSDLRRELKPGMRGIWGYACDFANLSIQKPYFLFKKNMVSERQKAQLGGAFGPFNFALTLANWGPPAVMECFSWGLRPPLTLHLRWLCRGRWL